MGCGARFAPRRQPIHPGLADHAFHAEAAGGCQAVWGGFCDCVAALDGVACWDAAVGGCGCLWAAGGALPGWPLVGKELKVWALEELMPKAKLVAIDASSGDTEKLSEPQVVPEASLHDYQLGGFSTDILSVPGASCFMGGMPSLGSRPRDG
jgi:hypothetical protein